MAGEAEPAASKHPELRYQLELFALCGFAFAQPILDLFGRNLETFVFRGADRLEVVLFGVAVTFVPWLVLGGLSALTRLAGTTVRYWVQVLVLSGLAGMIAIHVAKQSTGLRGPALAIVAGGLAAGFGLLYHRLRLVGLWARYASVAPIAFLALFLFVAPVSSLVFPAGAGTAAVEGTNLPRHVIVVLFDEMPTSSLIGTDARIDAERFPNFARFADDATWYRNYTSVSGSTQFAVPSLLSGKHPRDATATVANYPDNLFTLLGGEYDVHAGEIVTALCPASICESRSAGVAALQNLSEDAIDVWRQQISLHDSDRQIEAGFVEETEREPQPAVGDDPGSVPAKLASAGSPARLDDFLGRIDADRPTLEFVHLLLPHQPWHLYPSGVHYPFPERDPGLDVFVTARWGPTERPAELGRQRHLLQVQYVDRQLGRIVADLRRRGIYDDSLIVVTADHGAAFVPREELRAGIEDTGFPEETYDQVMWSPLLIKAPHQRAGTISDANIQTPDVLPTIADLIGIPVPWKVDGKPASRRRNPDEKSFFTSSTVDFKRITLGEKFPVDGSDGFRRMLDRGQRHFAPTSDPKWAFYRVGPHADLIGRRVAEVPTGPPAQLDVRVSDASAFGSVDPDSGSVPGLLAGNVVSDADATIAVAVNGRIAGVTPTFTDNNQPRRFAVLIPDFLFTDGDNSVQLFVVEGTGDAAVLRALDVDGLDASPRSG